MRCFVTNYRFVDPFFSDVVTTDSGREMYIYFDQDIDIYGDEHKNELLECIDSLLTGPCKIPIYEVEMQRIENGINDTLGHLFSNGAMCSEKYIKSTTDILTVSLKKEPRFDDYVRMGRII